MTTKADRQARALRRRGHCVDCAKAGRPNKLGNSKLIAVRLPLDVVAKLEAEAAERGISLSDVIRSRIG